MRAIEARRDETIDIAKSLAIVAIVLGHVNRGLRNAGLVTEQSSWYLPLDSGLYLVHLAIFTFFSGVFVRAAVAKRGVRRYARQRIGTFVYLYLLWSVLQGGAKLLAGSSATNGDGSLRDILYLWIPQAPLWFFGWLVEVTCLVLIVRPWESRVRAQMLVLLGVAISAVSWGWSGRYLGLVGLGLVVAFMVAVVIGAERFARLQRAPGRLLVVVVALGTTCFVLVLTTQSVTTPTIDDGGRTVTSIVWGMFACSAGVAVVIAVSLLVARLPASIVSALARPGRDSLAIFVAHITAAAFVRFVLLSVGVDDVALHLATGTVIGVAAPIALVVVCRKIGLRYLFEAPPSITGVRGISGSPQPARGGRP